MGNSIPGECCGCSYDLGDHCVDKPNDNVPLHWHCALCLWSVVLCCCCSLSLLALGDVSSYLITTISTTRTKNL